jgi:hypothetical protein
MNPNLTANLRAERELKLSLIREKLTAAKPHLAEAIDLIHSLDLAQSHFDLYSHVADAYFHCNEAISEHPQSDQ